MCNQNKNKFVFSKSPYLQIQQDMIKLTTFKQTFV